MIETHKRDVKRMTDLQLTDELDALGRLFDEAAEDTEGHGGSPNEWMSERVSELETEQKRRKVRT